MITKRASFLLRFSLMLTTEALASVLADSTVNRMFPKLTEQIGLNDPNLKTGEYEIRIWNRQALRYGDAQMAYVLRKTRKRFTIIQYSIKSNRQGFQFATKLKPTVTIRPTLWERLLKRNILSLPNESVVFERLYPKPEPRRDTTRTRIEADGSFTIIGYKKPKRQPMIGDGEGYSFELFSADGHRVYHYGNPRSYLMDEPQNEELQNVVGILDGLSLMFRSDKLGRDQARAINKD